MQLPPWKITTTTYNFLTIAQQTITISITHYLYFSKHPATKSMNLSRLKSAHFTHLQVFKDLFINAPLNKINKKQTPLKKKLKEKQSLFFGGSFIKKSIKQLNKIYRLLHLHVISSVSLLLEQCIWWYTLILCEPREKLSRHTLKGLMKSSSKLHQTRHLGKMSKLGEHRDDIVRRLIYDDNMIHKSDCTSLSLSF